MLHARGLIEPGETFIHESVIGTQVRQLDHRRAHDASASYAAVVPAVAGQAWITELYQVGLDPTDPFPRGFTLADTWLRQIDDLEPVHTAAE